MRTIRSAWRDAPIRSKILLPFALLACVYGAAGTYVFSRGSAAEERAHLSDRLRDVAAQATNDIQGKLAGLSVAARAVGRTEGVSDAVSRGGGAGLKRLALPPAVNSGFALVVIIDARGHALLELGEGGVVASPSADWARIALIRDALSDEGQAPQTLRSGLFERRGTWFLAVAAPIGSSPSGAPIGAVTIAEPLGRILGAVEARTGVTLGFADPAGKALVGAALPARTPPSPVRVNDAVGNVPSMLLYVPVTVGESRIGTLVAAVPSPSGLAALGEQAWKIGLLALVSLGGVFIAGFWVSRGLSRPLRRLVDSTHALERGDLSHRASIPGKDEVGELSESFNRMAGELEASLRQLEGRVQERTSELAAALEALGRANEAKSEFLSAMSHELRAPLSAILLAGDILTGTEKLPGETKIRQIGQTIVSGGTHLLELINDLLDLARIEAGRLEIRTEQVDVVALLEDVRRSIEPLAVQRALVLDIPSADGHRVTADPLRTRQILTNLFGNAIKFTESGGRVWAEVSSVGESIAITVADTGVGIEPQDLERVFRPFEQVPGKTKQGTGLGLPISRHLAEMQCGSLTASSVPGKGSAFTLTLPAAVSSPGREAGAGEGRTASAVKRPRPRGMSRLRGTRGGKPAVRRAGMRK